MKTGNKNVEVLDAKALADQFSATLATESVYLIKGFQGKHPNADVQSRLAEGFVRTVIYNLVYSELTADISHLETNKQKYDFIKLKFAKMKHLVQDAVADGFARAMSKWSARHIDYVVKITSVSEEKGKSNAVH